ncbi:hypothetical protein MO767_22030 [Pseudomonas sp. UYIF39]|uniref:hypothetical protein n=1 Tax=Pseudomonas sp. UYIF39 TaxID=1630747 RepID=UPI00249EF373|nr:hypothetical protein [Pseudomonas sp. UYIF39]MDI3357007.1 hypothetical protein [Pseudomonas sp. UYIF39]
MADPYLAPVDPSAYRYAVHCCSFKWDLGTAPDHALALFFDVAMARRYGAGMWPDTFEVVDIVTGEKV